jgi:hypothetical protein
MINSKDPQTITGKETLCESCQNTDCSERTRYRPALKKCKSYKAPVQQDAELDEARKKLTDDLQKYFGDGNTLIW